MKRVTTRMKGFFRLGSMLPGLEPAAVALGLLGGAVCCTEGRACTFMMNGEMPVDDTFRYLVALLVAALPVTAFYYCRFHKGWLDALISSVLFLGLTFGYLVYSDKDRTPRVGSTVPAFRLKDLAGNEVGPGEPAGRPLVLYFWNDGCGCAEQLVQLRDFVTRGRRAPFVFLTINEGQTKAVSDRFVRENGLPYQVLLDLQMVVGRKEFGVRMLPTVFVVDGNNVVREKVIGLVETRKLEAIIESRL